MCFGRVSQGPHQHLGSCGEVSQRQSAASQALHRANKRRQCHTLLGVDARSERVLGALLGAQEGRPPAFFGWIDGANTCTATIVRRIDVHNSFELVLQEESGERHERRQSEAPGPTMASDGCRSLDLEFFQQRLAQYLEAAERSGTALFCSRSRMSGVSAVRIFGWLTQLSLALLASPRSAAEGRERSDR